MIKLLSPLANNRSPLLDTSLPPNSRRNPHGFQKEQLVGHVGQSTRFVQRGVGVQAAHGKIERGEDEGGILVAGPRRGEEETG